ncbi:MAG: CvpA family protein [Ginsengibacter sp.]
MIIDVAFIIMMIIAIFKGLSKGLIVGVFSLLAFIIGLAAALKLSAIVAVYLQAHVMNNTKWLPLLSFFLVFIVVVLLVGLGARILKKTLQFAMLGWIDRIGGMLLYMIIYTIVLSIILFYADKMLLLKSEVIANSYSYKFIAPWGPKLIDNLGKILPIFKDTFSQLQDFFDSLAKESG